MCLPGVDPGPQPSVEVSVVRMAESYMVAELLERGEDGLTCGGMTKLVEELGNWVIIPTHIFHDAFWLTTCNKKINHCIKLDQRFHQLRTV